MTTKIIPLATLILLSSGATAENNYLCVTDQVSGFNHDFERGGWQQVTFLPGQRIAINEVRSNVYKAENIDDYNPWSAFCVPRKDQTDDSFSCENKTTEIHFNRKELRFTAFRYFGYWNGSSDSLSIAIGTCFLN